MSTRDSDGSPILPWELLFYGGVVGSTVLILLTERGVSLPWRMGAVGVAAAMVAWYLLIGRPAVRSGVNSAAPYVCCAGLFALFVAALALTPTAGYLLIGLPALAHIMLPDRQAYGLAVGFCAAPTTVFLLRTHDVSAALQQVVPTGVASIVFTIIIAVAVGRVQRRSDERARLITALEASRAEVARLSREAGIAEERQRLAGEIHDTVAQGLSSVVMLVQAADAAIATDPAAARHHLELAARTARENLAETRAIVAALTPAPLAGASLPEALRRTAARFAAEHGVPVAVDVGGSAVALPTAVEVVLLRAAQEGLTNAHRHGGARRIDLRLTYCADVVRLQVRDEGRGFDVTTAPQGYGLAAMRSRAEQVGGCLTIHSGRQTGTVLRLEVPA